MAQELFSECVFNQPGETITFLGIPPTSNLTIRVGEDMKGSGFNPGEQNMITRFEKNDDGSPQSIISQKVLKHDPVTGKPTQLGEEKPVFVKSFFPNEDGIQKMQWKGGRNKRGRKSKKYSKTKSKSRTRRGGRRSRRMRHRVKRKSRR